MTSQQLQLQGKRSKPPYLMLLVLAPLLLLELVMLLHQVHLAPDAPLLPALLLELPLLLLGLSMHARFPKQHGGTWAWSSPPALPSSAAATPCPNPTKDVPPMRKP